MQRIATRRLRRRDHRLDIEVGPRAPPRNFPGFVGGADVQRQRVVRWIDGDGGKAGFAGGAGNANGDLAAIGDQESVQGHRYFRLEAQRSFMVGSSTIRKDSPSALKASETTRMARPGAYICSGAISMY